MVGDSQISEIFSFLVWWLCLPQVLFCLSLATATPTGLSTACGCATTTETHVMWPFPMGTHSLDGTCKWFFA